MTPSIMDAFSQRTGFGEHRETALELLKTTIDMLEAEGVQHFFVSGTLLGLVRHNDFIPWDDDIDMLVDASILSKLKNIADKYRNLNFITRGKYIVKVCFNGKAIHIPHRWERCSVRRGDKYYWPFIDLFVYTESPSKRTLNFFSKDWEADQFYPAKTQLFNGLTVKVPSNPDYFLTRNYGPDYMRVLVSSNFSHKEEKGINTVSTMSFEEWQRQQSVAKSCSDRND